MRKNIIIVSFLMLVSLVGKTQVNLDSLWNVWENESNEDTVRMEALFLFNWKGYVNLKPDSGIYFAEIAERFANKNNLHIYKAKAISYKGSCFSAKGNYVEAINYFNQAINMFEDLGEENRIARVCMNLGNVYVYKGESKVSFSYYNKSLQVYQKNKDTTGVTDVYNNMGVIAENMGDYKLSLEYHLKSLKMAGNQKNIKAMGRSYINIGGLYEYQGNYEEAEDYALKSLELNKRENDFIAIGHSFNNLANLAVHRGNVKKAINYYNKSLKMYKKVESRYDLARIYGNLGVVYKNQNEAEIALDYYSKSLNINSELDNKEGIASSYNRIGGIYEGLSEYVKAVYFFQKSLELALEIGEKRGAASAYLNLGNVFLIIGDSKVGEINEILNESEGIPNRKISLPLDNTGIKYLEAENILDVCLKTYEELDSEIGIARTFMSVGRLYVNMGKHKKSVLILSKAMVKAHKIGNLELEKEVSQLLYENYKKLGDYSKALEMNELFVKYRDSLNNEKNQKALIQFEYRSKYEKQAAIDSVANVESQKIKEVQITQQQEELKNKRFQQYLLFGGLGFMLLFSVYIIKKNKEVKAQKTEVEKQREFAEEQQQLAENQKEILGHQNQEIKDSIQYAENLQSSVLPSKLDVKNNFPNNFVLYKPKDVVSGDFYWTYEKNELKYLAVVDCTGHGVPGAFMTIVANNLLNEIIQENFNTPKEIVEELHLRIKIRVGGHKDAQVRDSMDLGLFSYNEKTNEVLFVGTHTNLSLVRNSKLETIKGSKADIGYKSTINIEERKIVVQKNDMLYMHSDGYPDQKGGIKGKKFYYKPIREKFEEISLLNLMEQEEILSKTFEDWKGELEQFDDVCMIGVRI